MSQNGMERSEASRPDELSNKYQTSLVITMVDQAIEHSALLSLTADTGSSGHQQVDNNLLNFYRGLNQSKSVTVHGPMINLEENGIGVSVSLIIPGQHNLDTTTKFVATIGATNIDLPTDGRPLDTDTIGALINSTNAGDKYDGILPKIRNEITNIIGLAPASLTDATANFLSIQKVVFTPNSE